VINRVLEGSRREKGTLQKTWYTTILEDLRKVGITWLQRVNQ